MRNRQNTSNIFDLIEIVIDLDNKLYERAIKNNLINFIKEQESSSNRQSNISRENLVLIKSTII